MIFFLLASDDGKALTVTFTGEDQTLSNALRFVLAKHPATNFAGPLFVVETD